MNPSRNVGIGVARGEYLALLDSDDLWEPWKLALDVALLDRFPQAAFAFSDFCIMRDATGTTGPRQPHGLQSWHSAEHDWQRIYPHRQLLSELGLSSPVHGDAPVYLGCVFERSLYGPMVLPSAALVRRSALVKHALRLPENPDTMGDWEFFARLSRAECALFVDLDSAINRSHEDAVRLTRGDRRQRLARRISLIDRVWRRDAEFLARHRAAVDGVQLALLERLASLHLLAGDHRESRDTLRRAAALGNRSLNSWTTLCLTHVPGSGRVLSMLRQLRHRLTA